MSYKKIVDNMDFSKGVWFPITIGTILLFFALFMPKKRIGWREFYLTFGLIAGLAWTVDTIMGSIIDIYDMGAGAKTGIGDMISLSIIPSALSVIFLNYYSSNKKWIYVILFTILSSLFEWGMVKCGFLKYKTWHILWSIPTYLFMYRLYLPWHLKKIKMEIPESNTRSHGGFTIILHRKQRAK